MGSLKNIISPGTRGRLHRYPNIMDNIDCFSCRHFFITWEKSFPYGCKALGFKSLRMPSAEVYNASGMECLRYEKKGHRAKGKAHSAK